MILVFGKTGQVATELQTLLPEATFLGRDEADLTDPLLCGRKIREIKPEAVINAAAYTAVDKAEGDPLVATLVNAAAPTEMAETCADLGIPFVHISTDYVFDGEGEAPFFPDHPTGPLGVYGETKIEGENGVREAGGPFAILRTSWVFSAHGGNFVKTMLRLAETRDKLTVVADQVGGPTPARDIAKACVSIADQLKTDPNRAGTYHFSGAPDVSWADFAREIFAQAGKVMGVEDIPTSAYPTSVARPGNSRMNCETTKAVFGIDRPDWKTGLAEVLKKLEKTL
ncbi:dTDP-4-dehydrorhamnose reductase [Celeribacter indicus]|uniref:dTDP-4-dehydrorhamnose reductase n=1 Tax=Celeribacter indicus TaxID=1208324 RepID=A0A0B5E166_9RHOB|nr:dTDP-4-dehydrorhamnose reductase [Celeribacter indicus]AJE47145.1 dTDP-4-dehydrorhamnose reductase [Celeribacter indicus]SDW89745.1 dTDP-4-dehydrorhamnose reductase [Celeribacter indicus]